MAIFNAVNKSSTATVHNCGSEPGITLSRKTSGRYNGIKISFLNTLWSKLKSMNQCCGSGSACFWASRIRIRILPSKNSNSFVTPLWLFTSVPDPRPDPYVIRPHGSASGSVRQRYGSEDPHPDLYQNVTEPQHWLEQTVMFLINCMWILTEKITKIRGRSWDKFTQKKLVHGIGESRVRFSISSILMIFMSWSLCRQGTLEMKLKN